MEIYTDKQCLKKIIEHLEMVDSKNNSRKLSATNVLVMDRVPDLGYGSANKAFWLVESLQEECVNRGLLNDDYYTYRDSILDICIGMRIAMNHHTSAIVIEELSNVLEKEIRSLINYCINKFEDSLKKIG